jgi:hypothetical protein
MTFVLITFVQITFVLTISAAMAFKYHITFSSRLSVVINVLLKKLAFSKFSFNSLMLEALAINHLLMPAAQTLQRLSPLMTM